MKAKGFTLIELLVVISIIALLLSILMPALGLAKQQAMYVVCRSNLKSVFYAGTLYAEDNNDKLVGRDHWMKAYAPYYGWDGTMTHEYDSMDDMDWHGAGEFAKSYKEPYTCQAAIRMNKPRSYHTDGTLNVSTFATNRDIPWREETFGPFAVGSSVVLGSIVNGSTTSYANRLDKLISPRQPSECLFFADAGFYSEVFIKKRYYFMIYDTMGWSPGFYHFGKDLRPANEILNDYYGSNLPVLQRSQACEGGRENVLFFDGHMAGLRLTPDWPLSALGSLTPGARMFWFGGVR